jgi:hypothetical protein
LPNLRTQSPEIPEYLKYNSLFLRTGDNSKWQIYAGKLSA